MRSRPRGFTLIELLLAISILAVVAVLGWRGLDSIVRSRATLTADMEQTRGQQLAFAQMQSDCENLANKLVRSRAYLQAEDNRITLVRMVMAENQATRLQVVSYRVTDGVLTRRESASTRELTQLDNLWQAALSDTDTDSAGTVALQSRVQSMSMRLWVPGVSPVPSAANAGGWRTAAGLDTTGGVLVNGMEVSLSLQGQEIPLVKSFLLGAL